MMILWRWLALAKSEKIHKLVWAFSTDNDDRKNAMYHFSKSIEVKNKNINKWNKEKVAYYYRAPKSQGDAEIIEYFNKIRKRRHF